MKPDTCPECGNTKFYFESVKAGLYGNYGIIWHCILCGWHSEIKED